MIPQEIIRQKRDGRALDPDALGAFVSGVTDNTLSDAHIAAFCMATLLRGMNVTETAWLTRAMAHSGTVLTWDNLDGPVVDKHSTGGVGDKVSLMLAPIVASCGLYVPMIAGRGLGHTGGTVDKLESIPGFDTKPSLSTFQKNVRTNKCAIIGQTPELAPADKRIYAVRDVTATVESVPLITASILSKKMAAGLRGLVMDIKVGNGAFMPTLDRAHELGRSLETVAAAADLPLRAVYTDMNQILGHSAGNAVEMAETIAYVRGDMREHRLHRVVMVLASHMLVLGGLARDSIAGEKMAEDALDSGRAAELFERVIAAQGGPTNIIRDADKILPRAPVIRDIIAPCDGYIAGMNTREIGLLLITMGAGRENTTDKIDPATGFDHVAPIGTKIHAGETVLARVHAADDAMAMRATAQYTRLLEFSDTPPKPHDLVYGP